jgi:hypothetical protein
MRQREDVTCLPQPLPEFQTPTPRCGTCTGRQQKKAVARKAFESALKREFEAVITETRQMAAAITQSDDLWELEDHLTRRRKKIDRVYDYRYSVLLDVFAYLVREGRLKTEELNGLAEEKLAYVRAYPS